MLAPMIRRAKSLTFDFQGDSLVALNYLSKKSCVVTPLEFSLLSLLGEWRPMESLQGGFPLDYHFAVSLALGNLMAASIVVQAGTPEADQDQKFEKEFVWGASVGHYHFGIRNTSYMSPLQFSHWMAGNVESKPSIPLYRSHANAKQAIALPARDDQPDIMSVMRRRRSFRGFCDSAVSLKQLADCLFAGLGITGFLKGSTEGEGYLPLSMTPSGGGRNPYEAYVYAPNVEGLAPGTYHYSAADHSLAPVNLSDLPKPGVVLAHQPWFDNAAALILLVANFDRTMWKYPHPTGYRVVVLEAGHIAQNIILTATAHGLASTPTCAVSDAEAERLTGCTGLTQTTMYTVALGRRSAIPTVVDPIQIVPNVPPQRGDDGG